MKKMSGVTGYQVFLSTKKKGKYSQIGATRTTSFKMSKLKKNKAYYVKVRAYKTSGSRIVTGKYSSVVKIGKYVAVTTADKYAAQVLKLVNEERAREELAPLKASTRIPQNTRLSAPLSLAAPTRISRIS